jgi:hypothetical protein
MKKRLPGPYSFVDTRIDPGGVKYDKLIFKITDLPSIVPGLEVNLGITSEVRLYSDWPVAVKFGDGPNAAQYSMVTEVHFLGRVEKLYLRKLSVVDFGRVIVFIGQPALGLGWQRENYLNKQPVTIGSSAKAWPSATTLLSLPPVFVFPNATFAREGIYLVEIAGRRSAGTVSEVRYVELETGFGQNVFNHRFITPADTFSFVPPQPIRCVCDGAFRVEGSNEPGGTTIDFEMALLRI